MKPKKYNQMFDSIEKDIDMIDEKVKDLANGAARQSVHQPHAGTIAIAELLKAKALLLTTLSKEMIHMEKR